MPFNISYSVYLIVPCFYAVPFLKLGAGMKLSFLLILLVNLLKPIITHINTITIIINKVINNAKLLLYRLLNFSLVVFILLSWKII